MDKQHEYRVAIGSGAGLALLGIFLPYVWHEMPTYISYPAILMGLTLICWGVWPIFSKKCRVNPQAQITKNPEISIIVGHDGHYVESNSQNSVNVMKTVLIGVKNTGDTHLTNCKVMFEVRNNKTNAPEQWFREGSFSLIAGEERYIGLATYNEPLSLNGEGAGICITLVVPPGGGWDWAPPTVSMDGGAVKIIVTSAESRPCEAICKLWVTNKKLQWGQA